jgi:hypothetical protein
MHDPTFDGIAAWCRQLLGAEPAAVLFEAGYLSKVVGLELTDGRQVVVKVRPPAERLHACVEAQRRLWRAGYPCPQPLIGPTPLGDLAATAEMLVSGGEQLAPTLDSPELFAGALTELVRLAPAVDDLPTLAPPPAWAAWDHEQLGIWPEPDDRPDNLNQHPGPAWIDELGLRVRHRLARSRLPPVVGHVDWESQNMRWSGRRLHVVHDWDSIAARPEATVAGLASAVFPESGAPDSAATIEESAAFLAAYADARGRPWGDEEREVAWAAGLWVRAFNAKKASLTEPDRPMVRRLAAEAPERLKRAGA